MRFKIERRPLLLVLSAPSGGGKSAVLDALVASDSKLSYSISYTTRPKRGNEVDGEDYFFVDRKAFDRMIDANDFYEFAEVHGHMYGTSAKTIDAALAEGNDVAMDVDVQGGVNVRRRMPKDALLIYLMPPSIEVLEARLRGRASDQEDQIRLRMQNAEREMEHWNSYDYVVLNEDLGDTVARVRGIVEAERFNTRRLHVQREA